MGKHLMVKKEIACANALWWEATIVLDHRDILKEECGETGHSQTIPGQGSFFEDAILPRIIVCF